MSDLLPNLSAPKGWGGITKKALLVGLIAGVGAAVISVGVRPLLNNLLGPNADDYKVGACLDVIPLSASAQKMTMPNLVDCSDSSAKAKIIAVHHGRRFSDAESLCPRITISVTELQRIDGGSVLLCLVRA